MAEEIEDVNVDDGIPPEGDENKGDDDSGLSEVTIEGLDDQVEPESKPEKKEAESKKEVSVEDFEKLKGNYENAARHIENLNRALTESRNKLKEKEKGNGAEKETQLTDAQIRDLMVEYKDDPDTMLKLTKYVAEQAAKGASVKAVETAKVIENKKELSAFLSQRYPDLSRPESELRSSVDKTLEEFGLSDNPYGEFLAVGVQTVMQMPNLMQHAYQQGRKDEAGGKAEKTRKELVKGSELSPKGKGTPPTGSSLSAGEMDTAKRLGLKGTQLKTFSRILNKKATTVSMEG
jgi:hypothetical protein